MMFTKIIEDLKINFNTNRNFFVKYSKSNPNMIYAKINEIAQFVGSRYGIDLKLHFPDSKKIYILEAYGSENIGIVVDRFKKNFSISRDLIKSKAVETIPGASVSDAYMYEGKEGVRVSFDKGRLDLLPGSIHIWSKIDNSVENYVNWILTNVLVKE